MMKGAKSVREVEAMKLRGQEKAKEEEMSVAQEENTEIRVKSKRTSGPCEGRFSFQLVLNS